jgi:hypothetical protein
MFNSVDREYDFSPIVTPRAQCVCVSAGRIEPATVRELELLGYDYAPVVDGSKLVGLASTICLRQRLGEGSDLLEADILQPTPVSCNATLRQLLTALAAPSAVIISDQSCNTTQIGGWDGLVTAADLNRHYFRSVAYGFLAELEIGLARVIGRANLDHLVWLKALSEDGQARVLGYWQLAQINGVDTGPLSACMLTELFKIAAQNKAVHEALGYQSKSEFEKEVSCLPQFRNRVMHPVRPIILKPCDVENALKALEHASRVIERVSRCC